MELRHIREKFALPKSERLLEAQRKNLVVRLLQSLRMLREPS